MRISFFRNGAIRFAVLTSDRHSGRILAQSGIARIKTNGTNAYQKRLSIERIVIDRHFSVGYVIKDVVSGPGGDRTLVQTGKSYAFYTLISAIVFEQR